MVPFSAGAIGLVGPIALLDFDRIGHVIFANACLKLKNTSALVAICIVEPEMKNNSSKKYVEILAGGIPKPLKQKRQSD
ncbi:unnamed protein product [Brugia timori]|uniref:Uncharacterized protein n=1 Tax=Brugia timori TaxID=42155 RepID=A0A3P7TBQ6_9BILA|nr:unnamed protein product [Brugia timori]